MNSIKQLEELEFTIADIGEELKCHENGIGCCLRQLASCKDVLADFIEMANIEALCDRREARMARREATTAVINVDTRNQGE